MHYKLRDIPTLLRSHYGRRHLLFSVIINLRPVLVKLAGYYRRLIIRNTRIIAVVGSFGKTTTTRAVSAVLFSESDPIINKNPESYVALKILKMNPGASHGVFEIGIDRPGKMTLFSWMVKPEVTIVTTIGSEHNRSLGSLENTRNEKANMVRMLPKTGTAILNGDDPHVLWMAGMTDARKITFGLNKTNDIYASEIKLDWPDGTRFKLHVNGSIHPMRIRLIGRYMVYSVLAAISVALNEGLDLKQIIPLLEALAPTPGRMQPVKISSGTIILRDDYKSTLETIHAALDVLSEVPAKRRIVILGDVSEPPGSQGPIYRGLGERMAQIASLAIFITDKKCFERYRAGLLKGGFPRSSIVYAQDSPLKAASYLQGTLGLDDVILLKGRDNQRLERVALALMGKTVQCERDICYLKSGRCEDCSKL